MKKSQVTMFLLVGFVMFIFVGIIMAFAAQQTRQANQEQADNVAEALLDSTSVRTYIDSCVSDSAESAFKEISEHGGFYPNVTEPGSDENINSDISFMNYTENGESLQTAYLLSKGTYDINPMYPCPLHGQACGGPGNDSITGQQDPGTQYCGFSLQNESLLETCNYGDRTTIFLDFTKNSIKNQLEYKVSEKITECINDSFFYDEFDMDSAEIDELSINTSVSFGSDNIYFTADIPLIISVSNAESVSTTSHSHTIKIDFRDMFERLIYGPGSALYEYWRDIDSEIREEAETIIELNKLDYEVEHRINEDFKDDLFIIRHKDVDIMGEPFEFRFAIGNRMPALSQINYAQSNDLCEVEVPPGTNVTISAEFADPDNYDPITVGFNKYRSTEWDQDLLDLYEKKGIEVENAKDWEIDDDTIYKNTSEKKKDYVEMIRVYVTDGQYQDSQDVRVCVNHSAELDFEPTVEFFYDYSGFELLHEHTEEEYGEIPRITVEDPIKLKSGQGFSGKGTWEIGDTGKDGCSIEDVSSSCVVFPGGTSCDDDFDMPIEDIKEKMVGCFDSLNQNHRITFHPDQGPSQEVLVRVEECVPHTGEENPDDDPYLKSHSCCTEDFNYAGSDTSAYTRSQLFCGNPEDSNLSSNDFYEKLTDVGCSGDRGNYYEEDDDSAVTYSLAEEIPGKFDGDHRNCVGCGVFGTQVDDDTPVYYDYGDREDHMSNFETHFLKENDPRGEDTRHLCNLNESCVEAFTGSGRGKYNASNDISKDPEERDTGELACKAACNDGVCDYAVDCRCTSECGGDVPDVCDGKEVGEETGTCQADPDGSPYYPDICAGDCNPTTIQDEDRTFRCVDPEDDPDTDCDACAPVCDGKQPGDELDSCDAAGNEAVRDACAEDGNITDKEDGGGLRCHYNPNIGCDASSPDCHDVLIDDYARDGMGRVRVDGAGEVYYATICDDNCLLADSNVCWDHEDNNIASDCHEREPGEGFDRTGRDDVADSFCTTLCAVRGCEGFVYKGGEECMEDPSRDNCCYDESDLEDNSHYDICNINNPDTSRDDGCYYP
ncbi:MAG: hypothetical protein ACLFSL_03930 [Candidatus Woesearchaeota archaeon]